MLLANAAAILLLPEPAVPLIRILVPRKYPLPPNIVSNLPIPVEILAALTG